MIISKCCDCNHRDISRYKEDNDKVISDISVKVPEPFTLSLNCKHYYSTNSYLTGSTNGYSNWASNCSATSDANLKPWPPGAPEITY